MYLHCVRPQFPYLSGVNGNGTSLDSFHLSLQIYSPPFSIFPCAEEVDLYGLYQWPYLSCGVQMGLSNEICHQEIGEREESEIGEFIPLAPFFLGHCELVLSPFLAIVTLFRCWYPSLPLQVLSDPGEWWLPAVASFGVPHQCLLVPGTLPIPLLSDPLLSSPQLPHLNIPSVSYQDPIETFFKDSIS